MLKLSPLSSALVSVLLVSVSGAARVARVPVTSGNVMVRLAVCTNVRAVLVFELAPPRLKLAVFDGTAAFGTLNVVSLRVTQPAVVALVAVNSCPVAGGAIPEITTSAPVVRS